MQIIFLTGTKCKKFGPAQNILRPVKGQGINLFFFPIDGAVSFRLHIYNTLWSEYKALRISADLCNTFRFVELNHKKSHYDARWNVKKCLKYATNSKLGRKLCI